MVKNVPARAICVAILVLGCAFCGGGGSQGERQNQTRSAPSAQPEGITAEEDLPLETESIESEEIQVLETPKAPVVDRRPCRWAAAWADDSIPDPVVPGGPVELRRIDSTTIQLPVSDTSPTVSDATVEIVIGPDGRVLESRIVRGFDPPWPEGEAAIRSAVSAFQYEPPRMEGVPVSVCSTFLVRP